MVLAAIWKFPFAEPAFTVTEAGVCTAALLTETATSTALKDGDTRRTVQVVPPPDTTYPRVQLTPTNWPGVFNET
jgi:hypothetical protein